MTRARDPSGRLLPAEASYAPPSVLLDTLRMTAGAASRGIFNEPRTVTHIERSVLAWLLAWDPRENGTIMQHVAMRAANEARRLKAMTPAERTRACSRSADLPRLVARDRSMT